MSICSLVGKELETIKNFDLSKVYNNYEDAVTEINLHTSKLKIIQKIINLNTKVLESVDIVFNKVYKPGKKF